MPIRLPGGDDADQLVLAILGYGVRNQQERDAFHETNGLPAELSSDDPVLLGQGIRVFKDKLCPGKSDAVLLPVGFGLEFVPLKGDHELNNIVTPNL